jgi:hypothetical protein
MEDMKWFNDLTVDEKKYIENHQDPSHMIFYLKQGVGFYKSVLRGYEEHVLEDIEISGNEEKAKINSKKNTKI